MNDPLASALSTIKNAEKIGRKNCMIFPASKIIKKVLTIMKEYHYIGEFEEIKNPKGTNIKVNLIGKINNCGVIKPRFPITVKKYETFEKRFLPAKDFGILILSTPKGIMDHKEAKKNKVGGKLFSFCY